MYGDVRGHVLLCVLLHSGTFSRRNRFVLRRIAEMPAHTVEQTRVSGFAATYFNKLQKQLDATLAPPYTGTDLRNKLSRYVRDKPQTDSCLQ